MTAETPIPPASAQIRTFLIADVRGYTQFTVEHGDYAAADLARRFAEVTREVVGGHDGQVIELRGDEALATFTSARQALYAAGDLQARFARESSDSSLPLRVGIGLDTGEALPVEGGFRGAALNLAARLCSLAGAGEILASETVTNVARKLDGLAYRERGSLQLKGFADPVRAMEIVAEEEKSTLPDETGEETIPTEQQLPIGGFLGALPNGALVGRERELERLLAVIERATRSEGQLVLLAGEPGAGKTRLGQEATLRLRDQGFVIAAGRCYEAEQSVPYFPFLEALSILYVICSADLRRDAGQRWPYLGAVLPDHISPPQTAGGDQNEQQRVFRAVASFVEAIAADRPVAILVDDLHWADAATLKLLLHLARNTRTLPVLLLGTFRDADVAEAHPLRAALRDLSREGLAERIEVQRLDEPGTAALVEATLGQTGVSQEFTHLLHGRTEGNPYFVRQVLQVLVEQGDVYREDGRWQRRAIEELTVPESVRAVISQRLAQLPDETQEILREASVLGQTFTFDDLFGMDGRSEDAIEEALEAAAARGLVRSSSDESYTFDHALTQHMLYSDIPARRRRRLHLAAGESLERLPERVRSRRVAELARHFVQGADTERAVRYGLDAGARAEHVFAYEEAERQYREVLNLLSDSDDRESRAAALTGLGTSLTQQGKYDDGLARLEEAAALYGSIGSLSGEAAAVAEIAQIYRNRGNGEEGLARIQSILPVLERGEPTRELAVLYVRAANLYFVIGRQEDVLATAQRAIEIAGEIGDKGLIAAAKTRYGTALGSLGRADEGRRVLEEAIALGEEVGDIATLEIAYNNLSEYHRLAGNFVLARDLRLRSLECAERRSDPAYIAFAAATSGYQELNLGHVAEARALIERGLQVVRPMGRVWYAGSPLLHMGELCSLEGDWDAAISYFEECIDLMRHLPRSMEFAWAHASAGEIEILRGAPEKARVRLERLLADAGTSVHIAVHVAIVLAWARLALGDATGAAEVIGPALSDARTPQKRIYLPGALRVHAMVLAEQGEWEAAEEELREARDAAQSMPYPYAEARVLRAWGEIAIRHGAREQAQEFLQAALAILQSLGAVKEAEQVRQELAAL